MIQIIHALKLIVLKRKGADWLEQTIVDNNVIYIVNHIASLSQS